jgi:hypothetical protein
MEPVDAAGSLGRHFRRVKRTQSVESRAHRYFRDSEWSDHCARGINSRCARPAFRGTRVILSRHLEKLRTVPEEVTVQPFAGLNSLLSFS